jgi:peptide/nickel transport system permease protein
MGFKFVVLWTDVALWALFAAMLGYGIRVARHDALRVTWRRVFRDAPAVCSALVMLLFIAVTVLDSVHFRRALQSSAAQAAGQVFYDTRTESLLDLALARQLAMRETTYSAPLGWRAITKQTVTRDGQTLRELPRLLFGGAHLQDPASQWQGDVVQRGLMGMAGGLLVALGLSVLAAALMARAHGGLWQAWRDIAADRTHYPVRALLLTVTVICL